MVGDCWMKRAIVCVYVCACIWLRLLSAAPFLEPANDEAQARGVIKAGRASQRQGNVVLWTRSVNSLWYKKLIFMIVRRNPRSNLELKAS